MWTWIVKIALWALSGVAASKLMNSPKPNGWLMNILLGMVGGIVGSVLCKKLEFFVSSVLSSANSPNKTHGAIGKAPFMKRGIPASKRELFDVRINDQDRISPAALSSSPSCGNGASEAFILFR